MNRQDKFLAGVVVFIVLGLAALTGLTTLGIIQYDNDSKQFQDMHKEQ